VYTLTDEMFVQLDRRVETLSTLVTDVVFWPVRVVAELIMFVQQLLLTHGVLAKLTLVHLRIVVVVLLVQHYNDSVTGP